MPVAEPFMNIEEMEKSVQDGSYSLRTRLMAKLNQHFTNMDSARRTYEQRKSEYDKFKADVSNLMTEAEVKQFAQSIGI